MVVASTQINAPASVKRKQTSIHSSLRTLEHGLEDSPSQKTSWEKEERYFYSLDQVEDVVEKNELTSRNS